MTVMAFAVLIVVLVIFIYINWHTQLSVNRIINEHHVYSLPEYTTFVHKAHAHIVYSRYLCKAINMHISIHQCYIQLDKIHYKASGVKILT